MNTEKHKCRKERNVYTSPNMEIFPAYTSFPICWSADSASNEMFEIEALIFEW